MVLLALAAGALVLHASHGTLSTDPVALAKVGMPLGGARVESVSVTSGPHSQALPVTLRDGRLWPSTAIAAGKQVQVQVVLRRPGWLAWLTGKRERLTLTLQAPRTDLSAQYVTLHSGAPLQLHFREPVSVLWYGRPRHMHRQALPAPTTDVTVPHAGPAGSVWVAATPRTWERARPALVSWFPAGARASAIASPAPGTPISPGTPIMLTFSKPIAQALGHSMPPVSPTTAGTWHQLNGHTIVFRPQDYGYGLGAHVTVALPAGVSLLGGSNGSAGTIGSWRVPPGSTMRLQQLLSQLGYLPFDFHPQGSQVALTASAQEAAAVKPPAGSFNWRYPNVPSALRSFWSPGSDGVMTRGAVMAFENDHGLSTDGVAGPNVWRALIAAVLGGHRSTFGYTFVEVSKDAQRLTLWHDGHTVLTTAVNTGIAQAPTQSGTYPVYEHLRVTTMSGTNPDGTHYHDPGIQFVSYFNGGDALHAFTRAQYGFPQSLGCVEMPLAPAGAVWPYTPIGTLVHVD